MDYSSELEVAKKAAREAGKYLRDNITAQSEKYFKEGVFNYATKQDLRSDEIIQDIIKEDFPEDKILSEENANELQNLEGRIWIIDPIDGTRNYANGISYYSVSIALWVDGEAKVGVVYGPSYNDSLYSAVKGQGAYLNDEKIQMINKEQSLVEALVLTGFAYFKDEELLRKSLNRLAGVLANTTDVLRFGSAALDICQVAEGKAGAYFEPGLKLWDIAAAGLILEESGGMLSNHAGGDVFKGDVTKVDVMACKNVGIQKELVGLLGYD